MSERQSITIDGQKYDLAELSEKAHAQVRNIKFCDQQIRQLQNEWAIADTARLGYRNALRREISSSNG